MKIKLIRQKFNNTRGYKFKPFSYCCDKIKENPCIVFTDEVDTDISKNDEYTFPAFALWHSEVFRSWGDEFEQDDYYKINYCPFCGEPIEILVVGEEDKNEYYETISEEREKLWKKYNKTDSKNKAQELYEKIHELNHKIDWLYQLSEYESKENN